MPFARALSTHTPALSTRTAAACSSTTFNLLSFPSSRPDPAGKMLCRQGMSLQSFVMSVALSNKVCYIFIYLGYLRLEPGAAAFTLHHLSLQILAFLLRRLEVLHALIHAIYVVVVVSHIYIYSRFLFFPMAITLKYTFSPDPIIESSLQSSHQLSFQENHPVS